MRRLILVCLLMASPAYALTPVGNQFDDSKVTTEFKNLYDNVQARQFTIYSSTPNFGELQEGELVIVSSGAFNMMVYRANQELYRINVSCITVSR